VCFVQKAGGLQNVATYQLLLKQNLQNEDVLHAAVVCVWWFNPKKNIID
jgi:hypothetical protein